MRLNQLISEADEIFNFETSVEKYPSMSPVYELIKALENSSANVLIIGETGSGKELVAKMLHHSGSRKHKPFVPLNCTAIPEQLLESELFGHVKGSFTGAFSDKKGLFEEADGGSVFLDEIGDLTLALQAKLLRVLQDKQIRAVGGTKFKQTNVRIIAATHRDLKSMVHEGKFRQDLFFRLNVIPIRVPSLKERACDIPLLVENFILKFSLHNNTRVKSISSEALAVLMSYSWPGNVRELENVIERAIILSSNDTLEKSDILECTKEEATLTVQDLQEDRPTLEKLEERYIKKILYEVNNNKNQAAQVLGISRRTLHRKERIYTHLP
jgi:transcriptional regulator with PAS, ATPase and Fis domain